MSAKSIRDYSHSPKDVEPSDYPCRDAAWYFFNAVKSESLIATLPSRRNVCEDAKAWRNTKASQRRHTAHDGLVLIAGSQDLILMGELVNLKKFRKRTERDKAASEAEHKRVLFGRTKGQKDLDEQQKRRAARELDQHLIDDDGEQP